MKVASRENFPVSIHNVKVPAFKKDFQLVPADEVGLFSFAVKEEAHSIAKALFSVWAFGAGSPSGYYPPVASSFVKGIAGADE